MKKLQIIRAIARSASKLNRTSTRLLSTKPPVDFNAQTPWFVDTEFVSRHQPPHLATPSKPEQSNTTVLLPSDLPDYLKKLHTELSKSPHLEPWGVEIRPPFPTQPGPPLPHQLPKGKRKRGRTEFGLGVPEPEGGLWRWIVLAQVKCSSQFLDECE